jgi:methyl-accepting chemotaxis protein
MLKIFNKNGEQEILNILEEIESFLNQKIDKIDYKDGLKLSSNQAMIYKKITNISKIIETRAKDEKASHGSAAKFLKDVSDGKLSGRIDVDKVDLGHQDIAVALNQLSEKLNDDFNAMIDVLRDYERGIYLKSIDESSMNDGEIKDLIKGINSLKNATTDMLSENLKHGIELEKSSELLIDNMYHILEASGEQSNVLKNASQEISHITKKAAQNNSNTKEMQKSSIKVKDSASQGLVYANKTVTAMQEINNSTNAINEAIDVIDQIAFQTNILSLNAAVEAATAGEAGKGFAVVASEVRNLASRSADAAKKIKELVELATKKADEGKEISDHMINGYQELSQDIDETMKLIEDSTTTADEQLKSINVLEHTIVDLNKKTENYITIAHSANELSVSVSEISKTISQTVTSKEFEGKSHILTQLSDSDKTKQLSEVAHV